MFTLNIPNTLTLIRILLVPVLVVALLDGSSKGDLLAAIIFAVASATDAADGYLARSRQAVTDFGKLMDPFADKLLVIAAVVSLVSLGRLQAWVAMVIIARESAVTGLRMVASQQGNIISASILGKVKTITQIAMVLALISTDNSPLWVDGLVYLAVFMTILSGADYFLGLRGRLAQSKEKS